MNTVIIAVGFVLLVLVAKYIVLPLIGLLFKLLGLLLKYIFRFLVLVFTFLLYLIKWALISVPVLIIVSTVYSDLIGVRAYLIAVFLLSILDIVVFRRLINNYWQSRYEEYSHIYVLNKRSKIAHWFLDPSALTISERNSIVVKATDSELEEWGYRKKKSS